MSDLFASTLTGMFGGALLAALANVLSSTPLGVASAMLIGGLVGGLCGNLGAAVVGLIFGALIAALGAVLGGSTLGVIVTIAGCGLLAALLSIRQPPSDEEHDARANPGLKRKTDNRGLWKLSIARPR
jgi:hypothetical protein